MIESFLFHAKSLLTPQRYAISFKKAKGEKMFNN
jgi:hypothetical protein